METFDLPWQWRTYGAGAITAQSAPSKRLHRERESGSFFFLFLAVLLLTDLPRSRLEVGASSSVRQSAFYPHDEVPFITAPDFL